MNSFESREERRISVVFKNKLLSHQIDNSARQRDAGRRKDCENLSSHRFNASIIRREKRRH